MIKNVKCDVNVRMKIKQNISLSARLCDDKEKLPILRNQVKYCVKSSYWKANLPSDKEYAIGVTLSRLVGIMHHDNMSVQ